MSRMRLKGKSKGMEIVIGYDRPMRCWFIQAWNHNVTSDYPITDIDYTDRYKMIAMTEHYALDTPERKKATDRIMLDLDPVEDPKTNVRVSG
jgi:hypothetical protein